MIVATKMANRRQASAVTPSGEGKTQMPAKVYIHLDKYDRDTQAETDGSWRS